VKKLKVKKKLTFFKHAPKTEAFFFFFSLSLSLLSCARTPPEKNTNKYMVLGAGW
jgi:hypothetical protein